MLGHLGVNVPDLRTAKSYYDAIMPILGFTEFVNAADEFAYCPAHGKPGTYLFFYPATQNTDEPGYSRHRVGLQHLAFMMRSRSAVRDVHRLITAELAPQFGGQVIYEPQHFPQYQPPYFATFWLDPWGFLLEAVCHHDRE